MDTLEKNKLAYLGDMISNAYDDFYKLFCVVGYASVMEMVYMADSKSVA